MDNLCHSLVGAALAETGLRRRTRYATAALVLGANFPDLDIVFAFTEHGLGLRRGITHGIPALVVLPFVLTGVLAGWHRLRGHPRAPEDAHPPLHRRQLLLLSALAILTHPTLDWMNVYGMRWLMPFDGTWFYGDSLFILDPWLWLLLGMGWLVARRLRRRAEVGRGERFARILVGASAAYVLAMLAVSTAGRRIAEQSLGLEEPGPKTLMVAPPFFASWRRDVTFETGDGYRFGRVDWSRAAVRIEAGGLPKRHELIAPLPRTVPLEDLLDWGRFVYAREEGGVIHVDDARYSRGGRSFAGVVVRK